MIARVSGYAIGAGNHVAYFCDFTIAADHSTFGQNGPRVGSPAGGYAVSHAASIVGHKRAREMWMLCRQYSAKQALEWGLINSVVPLADLDTEVARWCEELLRLSPSALRTVKASFRAHMESYGTQCLGYCSRVRTDILLRRATRGAAVPEKRLPNFTRWR